MLFPLAGEWTLELQDVPLAIEVVRFAAPLATIASVILVIAVNARNALENYFVRYYWGHTVLVGLGEKSRQFLQTCKGKYKVVGVEREPHNSLVSAVRSLGVKVLSGDITDDSMFVRLGIKHADNIVIFTDSDAENVEVALRLRGFMRDASRVKSRLRCHIHLNEFSIASQLENYPGFTEDQSITEMYFFSIYDLSARMLLRDYPVELFADAAGQPRVHLAMHDGKLEAGVGGTAQVLRWYETGDIEDEYRYGDDYFEPPTKNPALKFLPFPE